MLAGEDADAFAEACCAPLARTPPAEPGRPADVT
jgi:hypothetical protein